MGKPFACFNEEEAPQGCHAKVERNIGQAGILYR